MAYVVEKSRVFTSTVGFVVLQELDGADRSPLFVFKIPANPRVQSNAIQKRWDVNRCRVRACLGLAECW